MSKNPKNYPVRTTLEGFIVSNILNAITDRITESYWLEVYNDTVYICFIFGNNDPNFKFVDEIFKEIEENLSKSNINIEYSRDPELHKNDRDIEARTVINVFLLGD